MNVDLEIRALKAQINYLMGVLKNETVKGAGSSTDGNIPLFDGTDGKKIKDSGKSLSSYVEGASGSTDGNIPLFDGTSGKKLKDSGIASNQIYKQRHTGVSDLDNLTDGGMYRLASVSNGYPGASWSNMLVLRVGDTITQIGFPYNTQDIYFRSSGVDTLAEKPWQRVVVEGEDKGTWTPVLKAVTTNPTYTGTLTGYYTRVGKLVYFYFAANSLNITNAGSGRARIDGLPYPLAIGGGVGVVHSPVHYNCLSREDISPVVSGSRIEIYGGFGWGTTTWATGSNGQIRMTGVYECE